ncbi:hypothetical protein E2P65_05410 [Candidatus Bathyarchaeota archaeon]|nr:hypothetical protein E2P65_05410 [Candidatus Bathyarchaeota archaeon]
MKLQVTLTPSEGKRLIGKAIAGMEVIQDALKDGTIVIATSTTTGYVVEELLGEEIADKGMFTAGVITGKAACITDPEGRHLNRVITKGKVREAAAKDLPKLLAKMGPSDIFVKGANAVDPFGQAGILLGGEGGGTMGKVWGHITANGVTAIFAVGLEKLVPVSLADVAPKTGIEAVDSSLGMAVGMMVVGGVVVTEMEAFRLLVGVEAYPIAGGGISGGEGSRTFLLEGEEEEVKAAYNLVCSIKGEPPLTTKVQSCGACDKKCLYREGT